MTQPERTEPRSPTASAVGTDRATRARDVSRPTPRDVAEALARVGKVPTQRAAQPVVDDVSGGSSPASS